MAEDSQLYDKNEGNNDLLRKALIDMAIAQWKLIQITERLSAINDLDERLKYKNRLTYYLSDLNDRLGKFDMRIVDIVECAPFDEGMPVRALNPECSSENNLIIRQVIEPPIIGADSRILHVGIVRLGEDKS